MFFENEMFFIDHEDCGLYFEDSSTIGVEVALVTADVSRDLDDCFDVVFHKIEAIIQKYEPSGRKICGYLDATSILSRESKDKIKEGLIEKYLNTRQKGHK